MRTLLPEGYYLDNFCELIAFVYSQYCDLLSENERHFYLSFHRLSRGAQRLYVRMLMRKGEFFRLDKLRYSEIANHKDAASELQRFGFATIGGSVLLDTRISLFTKQEWLSLLLEHDFNRQELAKLKPLKRDVFNDALKVLDSRGKLPNFKLKIIELHCIEFFEIYKLLFFGNMHQDLTDFILRDLGTHRFEPYGIDQNSRMFKDRQQIDCYLSFYELTESLEAVLASDSQDILECVHSLSTLEYSDLVLERRVQRVKLRLARQLERLNALDDALMVYQSCKMPPSRERQVRILFKLEKFQDAYSLCRDMGSKPINETELCFSQDFIARICRKLAMPKVLSSRFKENAERLSIFDSGSSVELQVASKLSERGECYYVENSLICSVFGLFFWDVIFAPVQGAFTHPFQHRPHDLYDIDFLKKRQEIYEATCKSVLDIFENNEVLRCRWREKNETVNPFVQWDRIGERLLGLALTRIPAKHWEVLFARLWMDLKSNRSGFPDLIHFSEAGAYELIEVKGPGDRLQKNQVRWLRYFSENHIPSRVIYVEWA